MCGESMNRTFVAATLLLCTAASAAAQTKGRVSVGASVTYVNPTDDPRNKSAQK